MLNKITHIRCLILRLNSIHSKAIHLKDLYKLLIKTYKDYFGVLSCFNWLTDLAPCKAG